MTVGTTTNVAKLLTDGVATDFPYAFRVLDKAHLTVFLRDLDGVVVKTYTQNEFSVGGLGENSGSVTITPAPAADHELLIVRIVPLLQETDIVNQGGFFPEVIEQQLDLIVMQVQQLREELNRAVVSSIGDQAYSFGRMNEGDVVQLLSGKLQGLSVAELFAPAIDAAAEAEGYVAALTTYTFGYIGIDDSSPPPEVGEGEGYIYTIDGRVYGALNNGGSPDVKFELYTKALADAGGAGSGTVTSVGLSGGTTGLTASNSPVTSAGTLTLNGTLVVAHGGTGANTAAGARTNLGAAASGANTDITSLRQSVVVAESGTPLSNSLGFRGLPLSGQSVGSTITLALSDASKLVMNTVGGWTIPANSSVAFPIGTVIAVYNDSGATQTVSITTDTLRHLGTSSTGTRTVAARGAAYLTKIKSTEWIIDGNIT